MGGEPLGRPKTLVRRHVLDIKEDTREWLEEEAERLQARQAAAGVAKSFLSTNAGAIIGTLGVLTTLMAVPATRDVIVKFISFWRGQIENTIAQAIDSTLNIPSVEDILNEIQGALDKLFPPGEEPPEIIFGGAGPVGVPLTEEQRRLLGGFGEQEPQ